MAKRTVAMEITVKGSAVVDVDHLLARLNGASQHPWAQYLLAVYQAKGVTALVETYVRQAYAGGVDNLLKDWSTGLETHTEHGGRAKFAPALCRAEVEPKAGY